MCMESVLNSMKAACFHVSVCPDIKLDSLVVLPHFDIHNHLVCVCVCVHARTHMCAWER
jgi:hypothetical protein